MANQVLALNLCSKLIDEAAIFNLGIALAGGCLKGKEERKDIDIIIFSLRNKGLPDLKSFYSFLENKGWKLQDSGGWLVKALHPEFGRVDLLYPESGLEHKISPPIVE